MNVDTYFGSGDAQRIISLRREIHRHPETGLDLPVTVTVVCRELDSLGIPYTLKYAPGSVVGYINYGGTAKEAEAAPAVEDAGHVFTIGLRADMDALPVEEQTGLPFASEVPGKMHACGHDAHTAMLLGAAKALRKAADEGSLSCRVKLIFQPNEEGEDEGAGIMVRNGVMDDVDLIFGQHVHKLPVGHFGWHKGNAQASCHAYRITFHGVSAHATRPQEGHDALAMAIKAANDIYLMEAREISPFENHIISIGTLHAGTAFNIIAEKAAMGITVRTYSDRLDQFICEKIRKICENAASELGGTAEVDDNLSAYVVYNDPHLTEIARKTQISLAGEENVHEVESMMGSEDFSYYLTRRPGAFLRIGVENPEKGCNCHVHAGDLNIDEDALILGAKHLTQLVLDMQDHQ